MSNLSLEMVFDLMRFPAAVVWERLYSSHRDYLDGLDEAEFYEHTCGARDVAKRIERSGRPHFGVAWDNGRTLGYSHVTNSELSFVNVEGCIRDEVDAKAWLEPFLDEGFRQARLFDEEYDFWQNAEDPLEYRTEGRSYEGLPMRSNGLPPPLEQMVIDTSRNPGRRVLRRGFIEAVGCPMWLGQDFWSITGGSRDTVCAQGWLHCETLPNGVARIKAAQAPFSTAEGEQGEIQERLRRTLYPVSGV